MLKRQPKFKVSNAAIYPETIVERQEIVYPVEIEGEMGLFNPAEQKFLQAVLTAEE